MPPFKQDDANNGEHLTMHDEYPEPVGDTLKAQELFQMPKEQALLKVAASALHTPQKTTSAEQGYPSPPHSFVTAKSTFLSKKRAPEDAIASSPKKKVTIRLSRPKSVANCRGDVRDHLLQNQMAAKTLLNEAKKKEPPAFAFEELPEIDPLRPLNCKIDSKRLWDEEKLNLGQYPRLVTTKLTYRYTQVKNPWTDAWEYVCFPIAPADDIQKSLHLGHSSKHVKWAGLWAEQKLQKEIAKYEAIKEFWLFNYASSSVVPFFAGLDKKEEFCVGLFSEELRSPWVRCWLREFLRGEFMEAIEAAMESFDEGRWKKARDSMLHHQGKWESLCLRFKRHDSLL
ncbi:hypothetical protein N0V82_003632 [Gnomoniopsis sp. IMI 355080]|nr:hypothetical protein N0V82_003632 [Gnomoniopsis sp. IMI 355080]